LSKFTLAGRVIMCGQWIVLLHLFVICSLNESSKLRLTVQAM
jgi:hypothetical protein